MESIVLPGHPSPKGMGWLPDRPDLRDETGTAERVREQLGRSPSDALRGVAERSSSPEAYADQLARSVDLRPWCSPVEDQGHLGSCTANAACGIVEYFQRRTFGEFLDASRLFLYKVTRQYLGMAGDSGAYLRSTMGALALFGVPPEKYWPYNIDRFDEDPPVFSYSYAQNYQALTYFRLDPIGSSGDQTVAVVKSNLAGGLPVMFGFTVYGSIRTPVHPGEIPFPSPSENVVGGHAVVAVGYDDDRQVSSPVDGSAQQGAFLIRNSWGGDWGENGYGWMPYQFAQKGIAKDWWAMTKAEWVQTDAFDKT